jgi:ATP-dependent DNA helicase RecQ
MAAVASNLIDDTATSERLRAVLRQYWGYEQFLPLQQEAMTSVLDRRDSLVVLPTGGGKSLCYQVPALCQDGLAVVVSPLIALMKDQVDGLTECGIDAAAVNSSMSADERRDVANRIRDGSLKLLYVAPERLLADKTMEFLQEQRLAFIAIDEAHCISSWGHDFRPEYRELFKLRERFPDVSLHAFTATATEAVRDDIVRLLGLNDPLVLVGNFQRPNLVYHVARRAGGLNQVCSVLDRNRGQSGIVYCISRAEVDETSQRLNQLGYSTLPYHAGMPDSQRRINQDAFVNEQVETMVATIAFGMGIDKSNVRYVIHAGMPRSLENYQQESGRAGRDGLDAECWLLYSPRDRMLWQRILAESPEESRAASERGLQAVSDYCTGVVCRHATLLNHFGQTLSGTCAACDICMGSLQQISDPLVVGQKILSCVRRVGERFGADHVAKVLVGSREQRICELRHNELSTWGLLSEYRKSDVRDWIEQLVQQGFLCRVGEYQVLTVTPSGWDLLKGAATPKLLKAVTAKSASTPTSIVDSWEGVDRGLFERLRQLRRTQAEVAQIPSYLVFSDATLRDIARRRPSTVDRFHCVHGVGERKAKDYGPTFVECVVAYCREHQVQLDPPVDDSTSTTERKSIPNTTALRAFELFRQGQTVQQVASQLDRALSTTRGYLVEYIAHNQITDPGQWVSHYDVERIEVVTDYAGPERLKPIFDALHGQVSFDSIRIVLACRSNREVRSFV